MIKNSSSVKTHASVTLKLQSTFCQSLLAEYCCVLSRLGIMLPVSDAPPSASALPTDTFGGSSRMTARRNAQIDPNLESTSSEPRQPVHHDVNLQITPVGPGTRCESPGVPAHKLPECPSNTRTPSQDQEVSAKTIMVLLSGGQQCVDLRVLAAQHR